MMSMMKPKDIGIAILIAAIWGTAFVAMRVGLHTLPPLLFAAARFTVASIPLLFIWKRPDVAWHWIVTIGLTLGTCQFGFLFVGIYLGLPAGLASLVLQAQAAFTALLAIFAFGDLPSSRRILGMVLSFSALAAIGYERNVGTGSLLGFLAVVAGAIGFAVGNITIKQAGSKRPFNLILWTNLIPPLPLLGLSWVFEGHAALSRAAVSFNQSAALSILYVAASTIIGFGLWTKLIAEYGPATISPFALLVPIFGISATALFVGENPTLFDVGMGIVVLAGLYLVISQPARAASLVPAQPN